MSDRYQFVIKGILNTEWERWFEGLIFSYQDGNTVMEGLLPDQPAVHGILDRIQNLNLTLLSVTQLPIDLDQSED